MDYNNEFVLIVLKQSDSVPVVGHQMASLLKAKTLHVPFKIQRTTFISSLLLYLC